MAQKSGFFNARNVSGVYDRKYNANDYSDNLAVVISNGVLRSDADDLKVTATGMIPKVNAGRAWIEGHYYRNDSELVLSTVNAPTGGSRYDRVMLRLDSGINTRSIAVVYVQGTASNNPVKPEPIRSGDIYDLVLADIYVTANATSLVITDNRGVSGLCDWLYSNSKGFLFKRYNWRTVLASATSQVAFSIPQYDANTCFIEVFVNGILESPTVDYTQATNVLTFSGTLTAGTEVEVKCYKSIDGTGIMTVSDEITQLQNQYATLAGVSNYTYKCTGLNDNISLSQIAQAFITGSYTAGDVTTAANAFLTALGGNTFLAGLSAQAQVTISVVGRLGATTPVGGSGTSASRYRWFSLGAAGSNEKRIIFDFAKCEKITIGCTASTENIIFYGTDLNIRNANVYAYCDGVSCPIQMIAGSANTGNINVENCRFNISTSGLAVIAENGNFTNCHCKVVSRASNAFCFAPKSVSLIRVVGGTFLAYIQASGTASAIFYTYNTEANAVVVAQNISCPTVAMTGYSQTNLSVAGAGSTYINGVVSLLTSSGSGNTITGQILKSKF